MSGQYVYVRSAGARTPPGRTAKGREVVGAPCGGKLKIAWRNDARLYRCQTCGREATVTA